MGQIFDTYPVNPLWGNIALGTDHIKERLFERDASKDASTVNLRFGFITLEILEVSLSI